MSGMQASDWRALCEGFDADPDSRDGGDGDRGESAFASDVQHYQASAEDGSQPSTASATDDATPVSHGGNRGSTGNQNGTGKLAKNTGTLNRRLAPKRPSTYTTSMPVVHTSNRPVVLWPQYTLTYPALPGDWLVMATREVWLEAYCSAHAAPPLAAGRYLQGPFLDRINEAYDNAIDVARKGTPDDDTRDDHDEKLTFNRRPTLEILIGTFPLTVLNNLRPRCALLDARLVTFINEYFPHVMADVVARVTADRAARVPGGAVGGGTDDAAAAVGTGSPRGSQPSAAFSFSAVDTPNIPGRVQWRPSHHTWVLFARVDKRERELLADDQGTFAVDPDQSVADYMHAKRTTYVRAVAHWNKTDGSRRKRIKLDADAPSPTTSAGTVDIGTPTYRRSPSSPTTSADNDGPSGSINDRWSRDGGL